MSVVGELESARVSQHVRVDGAGEPRLDARPGDHLAYTLGTHGATALGDEHEPAILWPLAGELPERAQFVTLEGVRRGSAVLDPAHGEVASSDVDLVPPERDHLRDTEAVPVCHQDQAGVALPVPAPPSSGLQEPLDFGGGQIFSAADIGVPGPPERLTTGLAAGPRGTISAVIVAFSW